MKDKRCVNCHRKDKTCRKRHKKKRLWCCGGCDHPTLWE